jgi:RNA polymerase sigma-70 factor (ECF subfamily)
MEIQLSDTTTDRDLIDAVLNLGDERAFRKLYRRHTPRLLGFISNLLSRDNEENEDIVQETWIRACEQLGRFEWRSAFSTWLLGIGLNIVRDNLRRHSRSRDVAESVSLDPPSRKVDNETRIDLERAIQMLPDGDRLVLVLHDVEGLTHQEIAEKLDIPIGTTKSQLFRARKMIRQWFTEKNGVKR